MGDDPLFDDDQPGLSQPSSAGPWRPRFGIGGIMLVMFICSAMSAMGYYMLNRSEEGLFSHRFAFIFVTLAAPMLLLTLLSAGREVLRYIEKQAAKTERDSQRR